MTDAIPGLTLSLAQYFVLETQQIMGFEPAREVIQ